MTADGQKLPFDGKESVEIGLNRRLKFVSFAKGAVVQHEHNQKSVS